MPREETELEQDMLKEETLSSSDDEEPEEETDAVARVAAFPTAQVRKMLFNWRIPENGPESGNQRLVEEGYLRTQVEQTSPGAPWRPEHATSQR